VNVTFLSTVSPASRVQLMARLATSRRPFEHSLAARERPLAKPLPGVESTACLLNHRQYVSERKIITGGEQRLCSFHRQRMRKTISEVEARGMSRPSSKLIPG
jgi:hypothetical protein